MNFLAQPKFKELDIVSVVRLILPNDKRGNIGAVDIKRDPIVGDIGTVVHVHSKVEGLEQAYIVECCDDEGRSYWIADFLENELEFDSINGRD